MSRIDQPEPGHYKTRLVKGGPFVPVLIEWRDAERDEAGDLMADSELVCLVGDKPDDAHRLWPFLTRIDEAEHRYLLSVGRWAAQHNPRAPEANPRAAINLNALPPIF